MSIGRNYFPWIAMQGEVLPPAAAYLDLILNWHNASKIHKDDHDFLWRFVVCMDLPRCDKSEYLIDVCDKMIFFLESCFPSDVSVEIYKNGLLSGMGSQEIIDQNKRCFNFIKNICSLHPHETVYWVGDALKAHVDSDIWKYWNSIVLPKPSSPSPEPPKTTS